MADIREQRDIYEVLGVSRDASPRLAREMYWIQVRRLLEQKEGAEGRKAIEELNTALAVVLDPQLREEYDAAARWSDLEADPVVEPKRGDRRAVLSITLIVLTALGAVLAYLIQGSVEWVVGVLGLGAMFMALAALGMRRERRQTTTAFAFLHLPETASPEDLAIAYRQRVQELLLQVRYRPDALSQLELLDQAYLRAAEAALTSDRGEDLDEEASPKPVWAQGAVVIRAEAVRLSAPFALGVRRIARAIRSVTVSSQSTARRLKAMAPSPVGERGGETSAASRDQAALRPEEEAVRADVGRRLAADFGAAAVQIASTVTNEDVNVPEHARPGAFLIVEGERFEIGEMPVRVGSSAVCDVMLDAESGVAEEHLLIWRRGTGLLLHVTNPDMACLVNGRPLTWASLEDGDEIGVGEAKVLVEMPRH